MFEGRYVSFPIPQPIFGEGRKWDGGWEFCAYQVPCGVAAGYNIFAFQAINMKQQ
jgi:hypothetical protein